MSKHRVIQVLIAVFLVLTYVWGLFSPITSDAGKYAAISRIIYETGEWINLTIHFEPYLQKPPLLFWITAPFYFLFGSTVFAFKLPVLLYSAIAIYSTFKFAHTFYNKTTARLAALILVTSEFYFLFHNDIHTDSLLTANVIFAVWQLAEYFKTNRLRNVLLAGLGVGLATISKGPIGVFVPVMATLSHLVFTKKLKQIFSYKIILGAAVALLVLFVGLIGLYNQFGLEGLEFFFWENNAGRIAGRIKGSDVDYLFYFHTTLYIFMPWGLLFFVAWYMEMKELVQKKSTEFFSLGGIVFYWIIISMAHAQAPHYFMVLSPFMAVLSAKWFVRFFSEVEYSKFRKPIVFIQYLTMGLIWVLIVVLCAYCFPAYSVLFWGGLVFLALLFWAVGSIDKGRTLVFRSVISIIALGFTINVHLFPAVFKYQSVIPACEIFNKQAHEGEMLNTYKSQHRELFFYAKKPGYFLYNSEDLHDCLKRTNDWIYTSSEGLREIKRSTAKIEVVKSFKHRSLSGFTIGFINPASRNSRLKDMYLLKIVEPEK